MVSAAARPAAQQLWIDRNAASRLYCFGVLFKCFFPYKKGRVSPARSWDRMHPHASGEGRRQNSLKAGTQHFDRRVLCSEWIDPKSSCLILPFHIKTGATGRAWIGRLYSFHDRQFGVSGSTARHLTAHQAAQVSERAEPGAHLDPSRSSPSQAPKVRRRLPIELVLAQPELVAFVRVDDWVDACLVVVDLAIPWISRASPSRAWHA